MFFQPIKEECILEPLTNLAAKMHLLLTSANKLFFTDKGAFWTYFFFPKVKLEIGGAAYTQVRLIHESLR